MRGFALVAAHCPRAAHRRVELADAIAQALADQRAEYEAVAVWLDGEAADRERRMEQLPTSSSYSLDRSLLAAGARRQREAALRIRQVGQ